MNLAVLEAGLKRAGFTGTLTLYRGDGVELLEAGYTGVKTVTIRGKPQKWYYRDGKRVAAPKAGEHKQHRAANRTAQSEAAKRDLAKATAARDDVKGKLDEVLKAARAENEAHGGRSKLLNGLLAKRDRLVKAMAKAEAGVKAAKVAARKAGVKGEAKAKPEPEEKPKGETPKERPDQPSSRSSTGMRTDAEKPAADSSLAKRPEEIAALAGAQAIKANDLLRRQGKEPQNYELVELPLSRVTPSQSGEDYENASSRELANHIGTYMASDRAEDYAPLALDAAGRIVDGNHRHAARKLAGIDTVPVLVPTGPGDGTVSRTPRPPEPGFTGEDALGRQWQDGKLVAKAEETPTAAAKPMGDDELRKAARAAFEGGDNAVNEGHGIDASVAADVLGTLNKLEAGERLDASGDIARMLTRAGPSMVPDASLRAAVNALGKRALATLDAGQERELLDALSGGIDKRKNEYAPEIEQRSPVLAEWLREKHGMKPEGGAKK